MQQSGRAEVPEERAAEHETASEPRVVLEEDAYESNKLKELGWSTRATRVRPLKGWFGFSQQSGILTSKVDLEGANRVLEQVRKAEPPPVPDPG